VWQGRADKAPCRPDCLAGREAPAKFSKRLRLRTTEFFKPKANFETEPEMLSWRYVM
jgi:hypothetical protein